MPGSGSVVRQAVAYAALTGVAIRVRNARARRPRPGLRPQHVAAVEAIRELVGGSTAGVTVDSRTFELRPGDRAPHGEHRFDIGTAGSTTALALALLPVLALRGRGTTVDLHGGIFQDAAPSPFHLRHVVLPLLSRLGVSADDVLSDRVGATATAGLANMLAPAAWLAVTAHELEAT